MRNARTARWHAFDTTFFSSVDTEEKAYWLGFITADGCVSTDHGKNLLQVKLKQSDAGHLEKLKSSFKSERPLLLTPKKGVSGEAATIAFASAQLVSDLGRLGVHPRKSLTATPWDGPEPLMRHYWRGMVDGDGMISKESSRDKWTVFLCGSFPCVDAFSIWAKQITESTGAVRQRNGCWAWKVSGKAKPRLLADVLYNGSEVHLDRKYALAMQLIHN